MFRWFIQSKNRDSDSHLFILPPVPKWHCRQFICTVSWTYNFQRSPNYVYAFIPHSPLILYPSAAMFFPCDYFFTATPCITWRGSNMTPRTASVLQVNWLTRNNFYTVRYWSVCIYILKINFILKNAFIQTTRLTRTESLRWRKLS
jgi:hypothetical protein